MIYSEDVLLDAFRDAMWAAVIILAPALGVALATGLVIGLLQALTSIQELTLTFVPKLLAIVAAFWVTMPFIVDSMRVLFEDTVIYLIQGG